MTGIHFIPFTSPSDNGWDEAWTIYENSFPYKERRSLKDHLRALENPLFKANGIWEGDRLMGILYYWSWKEGYYYVEHLAIDPTLRGRDLGSRSLTELRSKAQSIVLEIDPPIDDISIRRRHFYQRLGFIENGQEYLHPSFRAPFEIHKLVLMSWSKAMTDIEVHQFSDFVREVVLLYSGHKNPSLPR